MSNFYLEKANNEYTGVAEAESQCTISCENCGTRILVLDADDLKVKDALQALKDMECCEQPSLRYDHIHWILRIKK